jgi:hypothetical protein
MAYTTVIDQGKAIDLQGKQAAQALDVHVPD